MIGDDGLARPQGKAGGGGEVCADTCRTDDSFTPPNSSADQKPVLAGRYSNTLQYSASSLGGQTSGVIEQVDELRTLQRENAQFREDFLLTDTQAKRSLGEV